jgi:twinkle protein|tara:strand:+ start:152 stop:1759 length:1608 start_codon:yes stop_codon:yes gene_type:complete
MANDTPHSPCPYEECASSDAFNWNDDGYGFCHSCHQSYPTKNMPATFGWAKEEYPLKDNRQPQVIPVEGVKYTGIRSIDPDVCKLYGIQIQTGPNGEDVRYAFKYPHTTKYRMCNDKSKSWVKDRGLGMNHLFGPEFNAGTGKRIYITEGEFDAASLYQILGKTFPVKSLPSSSIGEKFIKNNMKYLSSFREVVYAGELDDPGRRAANKLYQAFPEKFYFVPMTEFKDANEFLEKGKATSLMWAAKSPQRYSPENFFCSADDFSHALRNESPYEYVSTGHAGLDEKIRGMVKGGLTFIKAPRGTGKTEVIRYFETGLLKDPEIKIALLHMEEMKSTTLRAMATYQLGCNVRTKEDSDNNNVTLDQVEEAAKTAADANNNRTIIFEMMSHDDPLKLLDYTRLAVSAYGADYVFVDHVQRLAYLSNSGVDGATSTLTTLGSRMAQLAKELNIGVIFISQVNDDGRTKYAASLEEEAIICIKIERNAESEDEVEQNTTNFIVDKNRPFAKLGNAGSVYYDPVTTILREDMLSEEYKAA